MEMNNFNLNISKSSPLWEDFLNLNDISQNIADITFEHIKENEDIDFLNMDKPINLNLDLSDNAQVQQLNLDFRNKDKPTNVLSFANIDDDNFEEDLKLFEEIELGDIILAFETLQQEASEKNISIEHHYSHLLIHGMLHLLGFDHIDDSEADYMEDFEINILKKLNINNPYEE